MPTDGIGGGGGLVGVMVEAVQVVSGLMVVDMSALQIDSGKKKDFNDLKTNLGNSVNSSPHGSSYWSTWVQKTKLDPRLTKPDPSRAIFLNI